MRRLIRWIYQGFGGSTTFVFFTTFALFVATFYWSFIVEPSRNDRDRFVQQAYDRLVSSTDVNDLSANLASYEFQMLESGLAEDEGFFDIGSGNSKADLRRVDELQAMIASAQNDEVVSSEEASFILNRYETLRPYMDPREKINFLLPTVSLLVCIVATYITNKFKWRIRDFAYSETDNLYKPV
jgi:hypothetical protein